MTELLGRLSAALSDRYTIDRELGEGGMAIVYHGHDIRHDRDVAIKVLRPEIAGAIGGERFLNEIRICAKLFHPHILTVLDSGEADGLLYYVMPLVSGESLRDRLNSSQPLQLDDALKIAHECADALAFAHSKGIVHRDIKPENILLEAGHALVSDFGIARALGASGGDRLTSLGLVLGTPAYMSPEQAAGDSDADVRSDIYSLGVVVFEMLSGKPPFSGTTSAEVMAKQVTETPPELASLGNHIPKRVSDAVARALAKNPAERFASASDFAAALGSRHADYERKTKVPWIRLGVAAAVVLISFTVYKSLQSLPGSAQNSRQGGIASGLNRKLEQLTFAEGVEQWPAWSPDGKSLAYAGEISGRRKLFIRNAATGDEKQITTGSTDDIEPAWSADGTTLAFVRARDIAARLEPADVNGTYQEGGDIWSIEIATSKATKVVDNAFDPVFSPDGKQLAFDANWAGSQRIWTAGADGRNPRQLTNDSSEAVVHSEPAWSRDSKRIVFRRTEKTISDIAVLDIASQKVTLVTQDNVLDMNPVWAPDGRSIYYSSAAGGGINVWRTAVTSSGNREGAPEQLTTGAGDDINPAISPDGEEIAFSLRAFDSDVWKLPVDPATGRVNGSPVAVSATTRVESRASWSPDGKMVAFNSDRRGEMNIWLKSLESGVEHQLTTGSGGDYQANWSPDGKTIAFFSARAGNTDIWSADVANGALKRLTTDRSMETNPFYSPNGRNIAFMSDRRGRLEVWIMDSDGANQRAVSDMRVGGHFLRWSPDGQFIVVRDESGAQLETKKIRVADGSAERLRDVSSGGHMSWSPKHDLIMDVKGHKTLYVYPLSGDPVKIFEFTEGPVRIDYPVWSPDGKWVLFDRAASRGGDLWIIKGALHQ